MLKGVILYKNKPKYLKISYYSNNNMKMFHIVKRYCHHHSKTVFTPIVNSNTNINLQPKITKLEERVTKLEDNITYIYLVNLYIIPTLIFWKM